MKKKTANRVRKRISKHPLLTPEKKAELNQAAKELDDYYLSPAGKRELKKLAKKAAENRKSVRKVSARLPIAISSALDEYVDNHDLDVATVIKLALYNQFKRKPPKKLPESVVAMPGNPNIAELASKGGKARAKKLQKKNKELGK